MKLHLVALLEAAPRARVHGIDAALRFVRVAPELVAAVEPRTRAPRVDERTLRAHDAAVRRLCGLADAVLPARLAAPIAGEAALLAALTPRREEIRDALDRVRGREQMSLRVLRTAAPGRTKRGPSGRRYLEARREALLVPALDPLRRTLGELIREERIEPHDAPLLLATVHHLVDRGAAAARYRLLVDAALARALAPPLSVRGPFPPYAFVDAPRGPPDRLE